MTRTRSLDGTWRLWWWDGQRGRRAYAALDATERRRPIPARVPGEVHLDAWRAGWIEDPYTGTNALAARWIEECVWTYQRDFAAPAAARRGRAWLVFEGLDLDAAVNLNGEEIGRHANSFRPCRIEVTGKLKPGRNSLAVHVESGLFANGDKPARGYAHSFDQHLHKRHWMRKDQSQFGWDWSTRLVNVGIHGSVRLEWTADPVRLDQVVPLVEVSADLERGSVRARAFLEGLKARPVRAELVAEVVEAGVRASATVEVKPGVHPAEVAVAVDRPRLWWPVGHGRPDRYTLRLSVRCGGRTVARAERRIGFRRVRVNQDPHPGGGRRFVIEVNGRPVFAKGANFVPADMLHARADRRRYEVLVDRALEANFNCLRVWGGGLYEADDLYELCDRRGLLVWQEFIYACARYPMTDEPFHREACAEARHQIRRLAPHPSLVVWCGNNEMEEANWHWGFDRGVVHPDLAFFHLTLPKLMREEDPTRYYQPSSPFSPDGEDPRAPHTGDQHPWTVGFFNTDFRDYRGMAPRFPNEGGILGPTALPTVKACLKPGQDRPGTLAWDVHENAIAFWADSRPPDAMLERWLGRNPRDMSLEDYVFYGGLVQGEGLSEYIRNFRRRMFDTAAAIFWMYNDCWPAVRSWTVVDYYLRRTPSFHPVRRAFAPLAAVLVREDARVRVYGVNEGPAWRGEVHYGVLSLAGRYPVDLRAPAALPENSSTVVAEFDAGEWDRLGVRTHLAFARLLGADGEEVARDRLMLPRFKEMRWPKARVRVRARGGKAVFSANRYAWRVCLDLDGEARLPDNFFDVWPGLPTVLEWPRGLPAPRVLRTGNLA